MKYAQDTSHRVHPWFYIAANQDVADLLLRIDLHPEFIDRGTPQANQMIQIVNFIQDLKFTIRELQYEQSERETHENAN